MLESFVEFAWEFIYKEFSISQGCKSPKSLIFSKLCSDHHIAFDNLQKFREAVWFELFRPFCKDSSNQIHTLCTWEAFFGMEK